LHYFAAFLMTAISKSYQLSDRLMTSIFGKLLPYLEKRRRRKAIKIQKQTHQRIMMKRYETALTQLTCNKQNKWQHYRLARLISH